MARIKTWLKAARLRTLPLSLSGIVIGSAIALKNGYWDPTIFWLAMLTTVLFQILSNFANDYGDSQKGTDNEHRIGPERTVQSGAISLKKMQFAVISMSVISFLSAGTLIYFGTKQMPVELIWLYAVLAILCVVAAITYTVGKKAYGYSGFGDVMVFLFFGLVSVLGVYSLYTKSFDAANILPAISIGLLSTAVLNLNNMRDFANDKNSGKVTFVVKIGLHKAKIYHAFLIFLAFLSMLIFLLGLNISLLYLCLLPFIILAYHQRKVMVTREEKYFDPELKVVALSTFIISLLFALLIAFILPLL